MYSTTITKSGQVTLPKELRDFLGVKTGQKVIFTKNRDGVSISRRLSDEEFLAKLDSTKTPKAREMEKKYAGKTVSELQKTPEYQRYYKEKYGLWLLRC